MQAEASSGTEELLVAWVVVPFPDCPWDFVLGVLEVLGLLVPGLSEALEEYCGRAGLVS